MSNQTSPDTSPLNRGLQSRWQPYTRSTRKEQERKRKFLFTPCDCGLMMVMMLFRVSCAAYPPFSCDDHHSSSDWAVPHCCYHCCRLCRVITLREFMPGNMPTVCITFTGQQALIYRVSTVECICRKYVNDKNNMWVCKASVLGLTQNVMQTVDFTVWELAFLYITIQVWSFHLFCFFYPW